MSSRRVIIAAGTVLTVTVPFWIALPAISYLLEIALAVLLMAMLVEGRAGLFLGSAGAAIVLGAIPGLSPMPFGFYLPSLMKAVIPPAALGWLVSRGWPSGRAFAATSIAIGLFLLMIYIPGREMLMEYLDKIGMSLRDMITAPLASQGYSADVIADVQDKLAVIVRIVQRLLPGLLILSGIGQLFVGFVIVEWYYTRKDSYFPGFGPFIFWKIPEKVLYLLAAAMVVRLVFGGTVAEAADNLLLVLSCFYAVCGLSLIENFLRRLRLPLFIKIIFYLGLLLMQLPGLIITAAAGLFDSYFDFRKVRAHSLG